MKHTGKTAAWQFNWTIRKKMLLFCMLLLLTPSCIIAIMSYSGAKEETDALIEKNLENSVKLMVQNVKQLNEMVKNGQLTLPQAQEDIKLLVLGAKMQDGTRAVNRNIDLGQNGYYYVINDKGINEFQQGIHVIEQTGTAFEKIVEAAHNVVEQIQEASAAAEEMSASSEQIYASLQELDRIASKSAESSEMISAATEEQIATMEEISHSSHSLQQMASELKTMAHQFHIA